MSRNKLQYYSGLAVVPNDVDVSLGNEKSVGKDGEMEGGSRYQREKSRAEWDWGGSQAPVMLGYGSSIRLLDGSLTDQLLNTEHTTAFSLTAYRVAGQIMKGLNLFSFLPPPFISLFYGFDGIK